MVHSYRSREDREMSDQPLREMRNPINRPTVAGAFAIFLMGLLIGLLSPVLVVSVIGYSLGTLYLVVVGYAYIKSTPRTVAIGSNGVRFKYALGREVLLPWTETEFVVANPGKPSSFTGRLRRIGYLRSSRGTYFPVTYDIALEIREAYKNHCGIYPQDEQSKWYTTN